MTASAFFKLTKGKIDPALIAHLAEEVAYVESDLIALTASAVATVQSAGRHTLKAGGKRLRPAFVTLCAEAIGNTYDRHRARKLGAVMELIHMATLIHDDVIDESPTRRGQPTANLLFGNTKSILSGDVLLAKAMDILAEDGDIKVIRVVSRSVVQMAEGEVKELEVRGDFDLSETEHLEVLRLKTASFIQACCEVGGLLAGATEAESAALRSYGHHVGLAFQMVDDILDYRGKGSETGKAQAIDFRDGQATLPLMRLKSLISDEELQVIRLKFGEGVTDDELRMICGWMESRGAFKSVDETAQKEIADAITALNALPASNARDLLSTVAEYAIERKA